MPPNSANPTPHGAFAKSRIFQGISHSDLSHISAQFRPRIFPEGSMLFLEGDPAQTYYLIAEGQVKIQQTSAEGHEVIMHVLGPGELIGALPTLGEGNYPATAQALGRVLAFAIPAADFDHLLHRYLPLAVNVLRFAAGIIQTAHRRLREMATERVERRIARAISRLASQTGRRTEEGVLIETPLTRQDLAGMTGTTLFTVSRTLKEWERKGIVRTGRRQVVITNPHALTTLGEDLPPTEPQD